MRAETFIIDDLSLPAPAATNGADWQFVADGVMGGVSTGSMRREQVSGRTAIRLTGDVSLENNGGFIQMALDLDLDGDFDASAWTGVEVDIYGDGDGESYNIHLRTDDTWLPWQSYRHEFVAAAKWTTIRLPFAAFKPYRIDAPLNVQRLERLGIVAIGRAFSADVAIGGARFYRD